MNSTFDPASYRSDLDQLSFSPEQKARMAQRLAEAASGRATEATSTAKTGTNKILELHDAPTAHGTARRTRRPKARRGGAHRIAAALGIATLLTIGGGAAYATGTLARAADSLAAVFGAGPAQTELIDRIGRPIGASCTSNGITITADAIIGMRHAYAVVYTIEKEDGTAFEIPAELDGDKVDLAIDGSTGLDHLAVLRLGITGGYGSSFTYDQDPGDNAIQYVEMEALNGANRSLVGETLHFDATKIGFIPSADGAREIGETTIATGDWHMSFKVDYKDLSVDLPTGQHFSINGNDAVVEELAISPLGASITYTVDAVDGPSDPTGLEKNPEKHAGHGNFSVTFVDGTIQELGSGYHSAPQGDETVVQKTWFFDQVRPIDDIASITVGDLTIPIK